MVYKHFGKDILKTILGEKDSDFSSSISEATVNVFFNKLYKDFMEHIDAIDNGISVSSTGGDPRYHISTSLSSRVGQYNPAWNAVDQSPEVQNEQFGKAMMLTCSEFLSHAENMMTSWWPARSIVQEAIDSRFQVSPSGNIVIFSQCCPWKDHLFELEKEVSSSVSVYWIKLV